jgi:hypothetical protein
MIKPCSDRAKTDSSEGHSNRTYSPTMVILGLSAAGACATQLLLGLDTRHRRGRGRVALQGPQRHSHRPACRLDGGK